MEENVIEFIKDDKRASATFTQGRYKSRMRKLAEQYPGECQIKAENEDGSLLVWFPVDWIRINPGKDLTDEQRAALSVRARNNFHTVNNKDE